MMKDLWLKIGCFITGHNYQIVKNSTEVSAKSVKKYLSAILIVTILWGFIGFAFAQRYLHTSHLKSALVALVMVIIVVQIERQIILTVGKNRFAIGFRLVIGIVMAVIGSVIIDQIMFKDDIEKGKISKTQDEVNQILPNKTKELDLQIAALDSLILGKENERANLIAELDIKPFSRSTTSEVKSIKMQTTRPDGTVVDTIVRRRDYTLTDIPNKKAELIPHIDAQIDALRLQKTGKENTKINVRQSLEDELRAKTGFLEELVVLKTVLFSSPIALVMWLLFFIFFLAIELFVLFNKIGDEQNDYEMTILYQMDRKKELLANLSKSSPSLPVEKR
jgi:hypothetical protein